MSFLFRLFKIRRKPKEDRRHHAFGIPCCMKRIGANERTKPDCISLKRPEVCGGAYFRSGVSKRGCTNQLAALT